MIALSLTRHGQTQENLSGILQGQHAGHLNATGVRQALHLRDTLHAGDYDLFLSSDLERARLTSLIVNSRLHLPLRFTPLLRERDWGRFTGVNVRNIHISPKDFPPDIEDGQRLAVRAKAFLTYIFRNYDGMRLLCMGHGYFDRCIQAMIEQRSVHDTPRWGNTEVRSFLITEEVLSHPCPTDFLISEN